MSGDTRWPKLQLGVHRLLDWVEDEYTEGFLLKLADAVSTNPHPIQTLTESGEPSVWDPAIEKLLRKLAASPRALTALNHRRSTPPERVVGLNRAAHFHIQLQLSGADQKKVARHIVAESWGVCDKQVTDDVAKYRASEPDEYRSDDAERLAEQIVKIVCVRTGNDRQKVLRDFADDMQHRGSSQRNAQLERRRSPK